MNTHPNPRRQPTENPPLLLLTGLCLLLLTARGAWATTPVAPPSLPRIALAGETAPRAVVGNQAGGSTEGMESWWIPSGNLRQGLVSPGGTQWGEGFPLAARSRASGESSDSLFSFAATRLRIPSPFQTGLSPSTSSAAGGRRSPDSGESPRQGRDSGSGGRSGRPEDSDSGRGQDPDGNRDSEREQGHGGDQGSEGDQGRGQGFGLPGIPGLPMPRLPIPGVSLARIPGLAKLRLPRLPNWQDRLGNWKFPFQWENAQNRKRGAEKRESRLPGAGEDQPEWQSSSHRYLLGYRLNPSTDRSAQEWYLAIGSRQGGGTQEKPAENKQVSLDRRQRPAGQDSGPAISLLSRF